MKQEVNALLENNPGIINRLDVPVNHGVACLQIECLINVRSVGFVCGIYSVRLVT